MSNEQPYELGSIDFDEIDRLLGDDNAAPPSAQSTPSAKRATKRTPTKPAPAGSSVSGLDLESLLSDDVEQTGTPVRAETGGVPHRRLARGSRLRKPVTVLLLLAALGCAGLAVWGVFTLHLVKAAVLAAMAAGFARGSWTANRAFGELAETTEDGTRVPGWRLLGRRSWLLSFTVLWTATPLIVGIYFL